MQSCSSLELLRVRVAVALRCRQSVPSTIRQCRSSQKRNLVPAVASRSLRQGVCLPLHIKGTDKIQYETHKDETLIFSDF